MGSVHLKWWNQINRRQLVCDFLRLSRWQGQKIDAYMATKECHRRWGILIDWHEFSYALEEMVTKKEATIERAGHITVYRIGGTE